MPGIELNALAEFIIINSHQYVLRIIMIMILNNYPINPILLERLSKESFLRLLSLYRRKTEDLILFDPKVRVIAVILIVLGI